MTRQVNSQQEQFSRDSTELGGTSLATQANFEPLRKTHSIFHMCERPHSGLEAKHAVVLVIDPNFFFCPSFRFVDLSSFDPSFSQKLFC